MLPAVIAMFDGERAKIGTMLVPILMRDVTAAICASEVNASSPHASPIVIQLYPSPSARSAMSSVSRQLPPGGLNPMIPMSPMLRVISRLCSVIIVCKLYYNAPKPQIARVAVSIAITFRHSHAATFRHSHAATFRHSRESGNPGAAGRPSHVSST